jgi:NTP pyrophosphatase (non-canonical NTP hydrolase)
MTELEDIKVKLKQFSKERDWEQFHSPKNLSMALSVEVAELVEHFQWLKEQDSYQHEHEKKQAIAEEIADIQMYLVLIADQLNIDIVASVNKKIEKNKGRFPIEKFKGKAHK